MGALEGQAAWCREGWEVGGAAELSLPCWPPSACGRPGAGVPSPWPGQGMCSPPESPKARE